MVALINFFSYLEFQLKCFKVLGLDITRDVKDLSLKNRILRRVHHYFIIACMVLHLSTLVVFIAKNLNKLSLISDAAPHLVFGFFAVIKWVSVSVNKNVFIELIETLYELFPNSLKDQETFQVQKYFSSFNRMRKVIIIVLLTTTTVVILAPIILFVSTGAWYVKLPNPSWYPFDEFDPRFYNFVLVWQWWCNFTRTVCFVSPDLTLYAFISLISMQFDILSHRLRELKHTDLEDFNKEILKFVKLHETLIRLSENLDRIFNIPILFVFFGSSFNICFFEYQISTGSSFDVMMKNGVLLTTCLLQILLLCYNGNKLKMSSEKVAQAAYDSGWYGKEFKRGKCVMLMIQRGQKPCVLTAFKFSVVSFEVYLSVSFNENFLNNVFYSDYCRYWAGLIHISLCYEQLSNNSTLIVNVYCF